MNTIGLEVREEGYELSDQDLDTVNGGFVWFVAAAIVIAADAAMLAYAAAKAK